VGTAFRASDFLNTLGVVCQPEQGWDPVQGVAQLKYLGVKNIRVYGVEHPPGYTMAHVITLCQNAGVKAEIFTCGVVSAFLANAKTLANAGVLLAMEGPNEPNNFGLNPEAGPDSSHLDISVSWQQVATCQRDLYAGAKADPVLVNYPVWSPTETGAERDNVGLQFLTIPIGAGTLNPDGTAYADFACVHNYTGGNAGTYVDNQATKASDTVGQDLMRLSFPLSTDFGNARPSTWGSHAPKPVKWARGAQDNAAMIPASLVSAGSARGPLAWSGISTLPLSL
jgi:hypothetical protein